MAGNISEKELAEILERFVSGKSTPEESDRVIRWFESLNENERILVHETVKEEMRRRLWSRLELNIHRSRANAPIPKVTKVPVWLPVGIAASLLLFIVFFLFIVRKPISVDVSENSQAAFVPLHKIKNSNDQDMKVALPDGSNIILMPGSAIEYNEIATASKRNVKLTGEAFFEVAHDKNRPFTVYAHEVTTTVLGTSFRIKAPSQAESVVVAVSTGRVLVASNVNSKEAGSAKQEVIIVANQQAVFAPESKSLVTTLVENPVAIDETESLIRSYDEEPIINILIELEKVYSVDIEYSDSVLAECKITTTFSSEDLYKRLQILTRAIGATYSVNGTKILILSEGCY